MNLLYYDNNENLFCVLNQSPESNLLNSGVAEEIYFLLSRKSFKIRHLLVSISIK